MGKVGKKLKANTRNNSDYLVYIFPGKKIPIVSQIPSDTSGTYIFTVATHIYTHTHIYILKN